MPPILRFLISMLVTYLLVSACMVTPITILFPMGRQESGFGDWIEHVHGGWTLISSALLIPFIIYRSLVGLLSSLMPNRSPWVWYIGSIVCASLLVGGPSAVLNVWSMAPNLLFGAVFSILYFPTEKFFRRELQARFPSPLENSTTGGQGGGS